MSIYLDHNATTPIDPDAARAVADALAVVGNPSSIHAHGRRARDVVEAARRHVGALIGADPSDIVFTSGGTEADCIGVIGLARAGVATGQSARVAVAAIEHPAVLGAARSLEREGFTVDLVAVDRTGCVDADDLRRACENRPAVVAIALANHEIGVVQDVAAFADIAARHGAYLHCDAVQAAGKIPIDIASLRASGLAISGHKLGGPRGVGAIWLTRSADVGPVIEAGHQERGRRPGTENVAGIAGLGEAARLSAARLESDAVRIAELATHLEAGILALPNTRRHGPPIGAANAIGNTVTVGFDGALGETIVAALDIAGISASTGAACTSGSVEPSAVILALGMPEDIAREAVRFSLGRSTTELEVKAVLEVLPEIVIRARRFR
jgi:cysteine desulfurase